MPTPGAAPSSTTRARTRDRRKSPRGIVPRTRISRKRCNGRNSGSSAGARRPRMRLPTRGTWILVACVLAAVGSTRVLRLNVSGSVPYGLYAVRPVPAHLDHGMLVVLPVPRSVRAWWSSWVPLLKPVAGLAGDCVCHQDHILYVNGADFGPVLQTAHGRPLPQLQGCLVVQSGQVFV